MAEDFGNSSCPDFEAFKIRGKELSITLDMINEFYCSVVQEVVAEEPDLDKVARCLIGNERSRWIDQKISSSNLTTNYSTMYAIAIKKWFPTLHKRSINKAMGQFLYVIRNKGLVDMGLIIFDQIVAHGTSEKVNHPIGFPSLIYELVVKQSHELKADHDGLSGEPKFINAAPSCSRMTLSGSKLFQKFKKKFKHLHLLQVHPRLSPRPREKRSSGNLKLRSTS